MKNFSVSKKILLGFLLVVLMIGIILAMTIITSVSRNNDLERSSQMNELQRTANLLLDNFNLARVELRSVFSSVDSEDEYYVALDYLDTCIAMLNQMDDMSAKLDGYLAEDIVALRAMFAEIRAGIVKVGDYAELALNSLAAMQESGALMSESGVELLERVLELTLDMANTDLASGLARLTTVVIPAKSLGDEIDQTVLLSRSLTMQQDVSIIPELNANLDNIAEHAVGVRAALLTAEARALVDQVTLAVSDFHSSVDEVETLMAQYNAGIASTRALFLELNKLVSDYVTAIAGDVAELNENAISTSEVTMIIMIAITVFTVVFSIIVATFLGRRITRPLNKMKNLMLQAGESGNLIFSEEVKQDIRKEAEKKDEIGQSLLAFTRFIDHITNIAGVLEKVANRDLSVRVDLLSDKDTMGQSLKLMLENLNDMFSEINAIAAQVTTAANEVAMGAQGLAQGSTEQASTIQEISASINEINEQMNFSNDTVATAAQQSLEISQMAQEGNEKMTHMTKSMQEINDASLAIGQVIKVIDDIAFQTNILALNAAVEAARAGAQGKGFAVVAEEVRNLAGKSAEAAKETSALISRNIEKAGQGLTYTQDTAESLNKIMTGIQHNRDSLQIVSQQSEGVKAATEQVNLAVNQVAQVVQQNSATSEQSAAASQQMSTQAHSLQELIALFKLRGHGNGQFQALPAAAAEADDDLSGPGPSRNKYEVI